MRPRQLAGVVLAAIIAIGVVAAGAIWLVGRIVDTSSSVGKDVGVSGARGGAATR